MTTLDHTTTTLTVGTYERVSRLNDDQTDQRERERSVDQQRAANEKACAQRGWVITEHRYADPGRSASRFATRARENWHHVLEAVKARRFDVLVLWETSRASRDLEEWAPLLAECRRTGVKIYVTSEDELYDLGKARHWKTLANAGIDNAFSSEETSLRVQRGVDDHAADGKPYGPVLYGYERIYDSKTKDFVEQRPHPEHAPVVKHIIESVAKGESLMSIASRLNEGDVPAELNLNPQPDGIPSPRGAKWSMRTVRRTCLNSSYIALRGHNGHTTKGTWPALVDADTFYAARRLLTDPKRTTTRPGRAKWLASCIASCELCGGPMGVIRRGANRTIYQCRDHGCLWVEREDLDNYLTGLVTERLSRPDAYPHLPDGSEEPALVALRAQEAALRAELDGYVDDASEGRIDRAFAAKVAGKLNTRITAVQRQIEAAVTPPALAGLLSGDPGEDVPTRWNRAPVSAQREVLRLLFAAIVVGKGPGEVVERVAIEWRE
ncbi:MAG: recombinase family protein [Actinomycetota bacterium]|nr:recombinase family protein [Actinomycetota bacterium]